MPTLRDLLPGEDQNVLLPVKVDAFVLNQKVVDAGLGGNRKAKIAPITQPNYSFLRLDKEYIQSDLMNDVDLRYSCPANNNPRLTDLGTHEARRNRQGVYIHWTLPRVYRTGITPEQPPSGNISTTENVLPQFPDVPTRWLVIRSIDDMASVVPQDAINQGLKQVTAWVIESDRKWLIDNLDEEVDLQIDVSPYVSNSSSNDQTIVKDQAEIFIGNKSEATSWKEAKQERVNLKVLNSSNQLFADYQPHCSNVFSMVDDFSYSTQKGKYIKHADASYYVIGWHSSDSQDLFKVKKDDDTRRQYLKSRNLKLKGDTTKDEEKLPPSFENWLNSKLQSSVLCHGAMYSVVWDLETLPDTISADVYASHLNSSLPISIGSSPMDALITYTRAHSYFPQSKVSEPDRPLEHLLLALEEILLSRDDGVESRMQASDMLANWNYSRLAGGRQDHLIDEDGKNQLNDSKQIEELFQRNKTHRLNDSIARLVKQLRWDLFSTWWKYVTYIEGEDDINLIENLKQEIRTIRNKLRDLAENGVQDSGNVAEKDPFRPGVLDPFYQQRDPTLLVGGVKSGWEADYLEKLQLRLDSQVVAEAKGSVTGEESYFKAIENVLTQLPSKTLKTSAEALVREFIVLRSKRKEDDTGKKIEEQSPLFHDKLSKDSKKQAAWRDLWNRTQPWFPLFLEWEAEYTHVPRDLWSLEPRRMLHSEATKLHYAINKGVDLQDHFKNRDKRDSRKVSGRVLILPQPTFSLRTKIEQLFSDTPASILDRILKPEEREFVLKHLDELEFLSAPLAGLNNHLATLEQGNHVKPLSTDPISGALIALPEAQRELYDKTTLELIHEESDLTPYAANMRPSKLYSAFKPVAHGQFKFTRLNIMDKFGQAIHAIDPTPSPRPPKVIPCLSEWYAPQGLQANPDIPNVIERDDNLPQFCEYVQIPPQLSQPSRLNAVFVVPRDKKQPKVQDLTAPAPLFWRMANEWDNPIWGWVIINYANYGIQLFLADGTFYREVRLSSTERGQEPEWLPFKEPDDPDSTSSSNIRQLALLIQQLQKRDNLNKFVDVINLALSNTPPAPGAYAEFRNSLIGQPLALTNIGWSLELAGPPFVSQMIYDKEPELRLLPKYKEDKSVYTFPIKIGDNERGFDGLVGYFNTKHNPLWGDAIDLSTIYTHFEKKQRVPNHEDDEADAEKDDNDSTQESPPQVTIIQPKNYPPLIATWVDPQGKDKDVYNDAFTRNLFVICALMNPFYPVHAYSGILPVRALSLPNWTWQTSMEKMKAFFHAGPVLVTTDVPDFDPGRELKSDKPVQAVGRDKGAGGVEIPSLAADSWMWLQPYVANVPENSYDSDGDQPTEKYMPLTIGPEDGTYRSKPGPYIALEGYLQLASTPGKAGK